jgi:aspartate/glutamate racemase
MRFIYLFGSLCLLPLNSCKDGSNPSSNIARQEAKADGSAETLGRMSMGELQAFVQTQATPQDLADLAERQFYFVVRNNFIQNAAAYWSLQQAIAEKIPTEFSRPVFDLRFIFKDNLAPVEPKRTVGILGGTGPLSDATIMRLVFRQLKPEAMAAGSMIHLFSLPPPRTISSQAFGGLTYGARLTTFMRHGYQEYFLASNTAHLNIDTLRQLSGAEAHLNNLPRAIAERIFNETKATTGSKSILILGTKQAWDKRLYPNIFEEQHVPYKSLTSIEEDEIQAWIDRIKQGTMRAADQLRLRDDILKLAKIHGVQEILLACTELPLGLGSLIKDIEQTGLKVYDSEEMIADMIAHKTQAIGQ